MTLELDERQRAMLREMGVMVWSQPPSQIGAAVPPERDVPARPANAARAAGALGRHRTPETAGQPHAPDISTSRAATGRTDAVPAAPVPAPTASPVSGLLALGPWQTLRPAEAADGAPAWLVIAECPGSDLLAGDAGRLLQNMLRALRLPPGVPVLGAVVSRTATGAAESTGVVRALDAAVVQHRPAMVLSMGRLAAQGALDSGEPLGRLRGTVHRIASGVPLVATYDAAYLLRAQADKARAWEDLCRARAAAQAAA